MKTTQITGCGRRGCSKPGAREVSRRVCLPVGRATIHPLLAHRRFVLRLLAAALLAALSGCASTAPRATPTADDAYVPGFKRVAAGYRPLLPLYAAAVTYLGCEGMDAEEIADIQKEFALRLTNPDGKPDGKYNQLIGAVVINGVANDDVQTSFTIWLLDGRRQDSGEMFLANDQRGFDRLHMGRPMCLRALQMLRKAVPEAKVQAAEHAPIP